MLPFIESQIRMLIYSNTSQNIKKCHRFWSRMRKTRWGLRKWLKLSYHILKRQILFINSRQRHNALTHYRSTHMCCNTPCCLCTCVVYQIFECCIVMSLCNLLKLVLCVALYTGSQVYFIFSSNFKV